jgi:cytoskeletal protein RodZ
LIAPLEERLTAVEQAVSATSRRFSRERLVYAVVISFLVGLMVVTALQALMNLRSPLADTTGAAAPNRQPGAARGASAPGEAAPLAASAASAKKGSADGAPEGRAVVATDASRAVATDASRAPAATQDGTPTTTQNGTPAATAALQGASPDSSRATGGARKTGETSNARGYDVRVLLEVRDGQVTDARVLNPRPGAKAYEALALKTARQRRYPKNFTGGDTWKVRVKP